MQAKPERPDYYRRDSREYFRVNTDARGNVVAEFNLWDPSQEKQVVTVLSYLPKEAQLVSEMLLRQADLPEW